MGNVFPIIDSPSSASRTQSQPSARNPNTPLSDAKEETQLRKRAGPIVACLLILSHVKPQLLCQSGKGMATTVSLPAESSLQDTLHAEEQTGTVLFYTQSYVDSDNQRVNYHGSVYGFIKNAELKDCSLNVDFILADHFSGVVKKQPTGSLEDDELYSATIPLTHILALSLVDAPPTAIANGTNSVCATRPSCAFTWLKITAKDSSIRETRTTNGWLDFAGNTKTFFLPISTPDAGRNLIQQIQSFADAACSQTSMSQSSAK